jgi:hypothetical protein
MPDAQHKPPIRPCSGKRSGPEEYEHVCGRGGSTQHEAAIEAIAVEILRDALFRSDSMYDATTLARKAAAAYDAARGTDDLKCERDELAGRLVAERDAHLEQEARLRAARSGEAEGFTADEVEALIDKAVHAAISPRVNRETAPRLIETLFIKACEERAALAEHPEPRQDQPVDRASGQTPSADSLCTCGHPFSWHWDDSAHCEHGDDTTGKRCACEKFIAVEHPETSERPEPLEDGGEREACPATFEFQPCIHLAPHSGKHRTTGGDEWAQDQPPEAENLAGAFERAENAEADVEHLKGLLNIAEDGLTYIAAHGSKASGRYAAKVSGEICA